MMKEKQTKQGKQANKKKPKIKLKRSHRITFGMNDAEYKAVQRHLKKYKIANKAEWYRRTLLAEIWKKLGEDLPMLFDENDMRQDTFVADSEAKYNQELKRVTLFDDQNNLS